jgi:hypothetical protein
MKKDNDFLKLKKDLDDSRTEEDILKFLILLVKKFSFDKYKDIFYSNPYYRALLPDIKKDVFREILFLRDSLMAEVENIDNQLKIIDNPNSEKLKELKRDCISLIYEVDEKYREIDSLK